MKEYENIYAFLKEGGQKTRLGAIGSRIDRVVEQKAVLARLLDMEVVVKSYRKLRLLR